MTPDILKIGDQEIARGERRRVDIPVAKLYDHTSIHLTAEVVRGKQDGPSLFVSAAIHGDEINGTEIIKRLIEKRRTLRRLRGTLILVPVVNPFGYNRNIRYLPDRRDLNRCFPGEDKGSLAAQIAYAFMQEIVGNATHGIDLHTGAIHRTNFPQIRANLDSPGVESLAKIFGVPVVLNSILRDGSLRQAVADKGVPILLFEGGEALRHEEHVIRVGLRGVLNVMRSIGMLETKKEDRSKPSQVFIARGSYWVRASVSGSVQFKVPMGKSVKKNQVIAIISDPFGDHKEELVARREGIVIGRITMPLVNNGDAIAHIATFSDADAVAEYVESLEDNLEDVAPGQRDMV